ncbi:MAG: transglycosylase SLT domain-containing protein, partial [Nitrospiria bacterium]
LYPHQEAYYKILYLSGNYYENHHQEARARAFYQSIIKELPQSAIVPDALWKDGWGAYQKGDYITADKDYSKLLDQYPSSVLQVQALYWKGRTKEKTGQFDEAQINFKKLCQNFFHSYYCHLAKKRMITTEWDSISSSSTDPPPGSVIDPSLQPSQEYQKDNHYLKAKELMSMNLTLEATKELTFLADHYKDKVTQLQIDKELIQAGDFYHAFKNLRSQFPDILDRGKTYDLPLLWELAYPKEVISLIIKTAKEIKVEPEFVAGIMREESVFDIKATSKSGAMGLMQLMPFTGEWVAQQLGVASFVREKLYDQDLNIQFGAYYLDHLNQKFQGNLIYTAASYNAGPEAVNKWILNGNYNDLEEFVENIPNRETRYYVKKVIKSYEEFKELNPRAD